MGIWSALIPTFGSLTVFPFHGEVEKFYREENLIFFRIDFLLGRFYLKKKLETLTMVKLT